MTVKTEKQEIQCRLCKQRVRVVQVARLRSVNFHTTDATGIGEACPESYQPVSP